MPIDYTPFRLPIASAGGLPGETAPDGSRYPSFGLTSRSSPESKIAFDVREWDLLARRLENLLGLEVIRAAGGGRDIQVGKGVYTKSDGTRVSFASATLTISASATAQKLYILVATNALTQAASWPASESDYVPLAEIDTDASDVTAIRDRRAWLVNRIPPTGLDTGTTAQPDFILDADNTDPGVNMQLRFNRGTDGATQDAALRWDENVDRFKLLEQHTSNTLTKLELSEVWIGGAAILTSSGVAKVQAGVAGNGLSESSGVLAVNVDGSTLEIAADQVRVKDSGVTAAKLSDALADTLPVVTITSPSGSSASQTVTVQIKDKQGNNLAEVVYLEIGLFQDQHAAAFATTAVLNATPSVGTRDAWLTTNKHGRYHTDANGTLTFTVDSLTSPETVYVLAAVGFKSRALDCVNMGTVTRT